MKLFSTVIDLSDEVKISVIDDLNQQLANMILAQLVVKFAHWNVKGVGFYPAHKLIDKLYGVVEEGVDQVAERIVALGGVARGLPAQAINSSTLEEYEADENSDVQEHISALSKTIGYLANGLRSSAATAMEKADLVTQNRVLGIAETLDQYIYFLEGHLR